MSAYADDARHESFRGNIIKVTEKDRENGELLTTREGRVPAHVES